jgi:excisionase family DNA binding protein
VATAAHATAEYELLAAAARRLGVSVRTLRRYAKGGAFPIYRLGPKGWPRVRRREIDAFMDDQRVDVGEDSARHVEERLAEVLAREAPRAGGEP